MKKQNYFYHLLLSAAFVTALAAPLYAYDGGENVYSAHPAEENTQDGPGIGIDTKAGHDTSVSTKMTSKNTEQIVKQLDDTNDRIASGNAAIGTLNGLWGSIHKGVRDDTKDFGDRFTEVKGLQNKARLDHGASTSGRTNTATPETATRAALEGKDNGQAAQKLFHDAISGLLKNKKGCTGQGCQNKDIKDNGGYDLLDVSDLMRNGCDYLGICEIMAENIKRAAEGKVFANEAPATQKNLAKLISAGAGAGQYKGMAQDVGSLCGGGLNNPIKPGEQGMNAVLLAGIVRQPQGENCVDIFPSGSNTSAIAMAEDWKRFNCRAQAQGAMQRVVSACVGSMSPPAGSCKNQMAFQQGVKATGMKGTQDGKCSSNIELARDGTGALAMIAGKAGQTEAGNGPQAAKGRDAFGRAVATSNSVFGLSGVTGGGGTVGGLTALSELYDMPLFRNEKFLAMLESKEFMVAYINAPALGEGSYFDRMPILIANAWDSIKGNGAILYAEYVKDKPELYAKNEKIYVSLFEFKPFPYEKGNMLAHKRQDRLEQDQRMYAEQLRQLDEQDNQEVQPVAYDTNNMSLYELLQKVGIAVNAQGQNAGNVAVPISIVMPELPAPNAEPEPEMRATDIKYSGHLKATPISTSVWQ